MAYRALIILIEPPLPFGNAASRWFHVLVQGFKARGYDFDVLVTSGNEKDLDKARVVFKDWRNMHFFAFEKPKGFLSKIKTILYPQKFSLSAEFLKKLESLNPDSYDIIHVEQTWAGWGTWAWPHKTLINVHFLLAIDLELEKPKELKYKLMFQRWFAAEKKILDHYPHIRTCSPRLKEHIQSWGIPKKHLESIPFGIDLSLYPFISASQRQTQEPIITVIGNMQWSPSLSAAKRLAGELWPEILRQIPNARLRIVGWAAREHLKDFLDQPQIEILENVPEIQPYFEQASVLVYAPGRGSGMKIKIQEALAFGVPVVTNSEGVEGLNVKDMVHVALGETNEELIAKTVQILKDPSLQESLRVHGRKMLEEQCGPEVTLSQIEKLHRRIIASHRPI